jgi:hypothetical protein
MKKKILIAAGALVGLIVVVLVAGIFLLNPQKIVAAKKDDALKMLSEKIGREVTAGEVTASVGTELKARITALQIAGAPGKQPQAYVGSVDMKFSLVRALLTFGNDLYVEKFTVQGLVLRAARDGQGRWDFQDILDKLAGDPAAAPEEKSSKSALEGLRIASMRILDGRVELDDKMLGRPLAVGNLNIDVSDVVLGQPLAVNLKASLEDGARKSPIDVTTRLAVLPKDLSFDPLPDLDVKAQLVDVDLGPWGGLAPSDVPAPVQGTLRTDLVLTAKDDAKKLSVDGNVLLRGLVIREAVSAVADVAERNAAPRGSPLDADITLSAALDSEKPRYEVKKLTVKGNGLDLVASVDAAGTSLAALEKADVQATAQDLNRVLAVLPPSLRGLPEAVRIEGPLAARLVGSAAEIDATVNLDNARVRYMDMPEDGSAATAALFDKPVQKPLNLTLHGKRGSSALDVDRFALVVDTAKIGGTLSLPTAKDAPLVADITSGPVELVSLQGLVPPFKDAIGRGQRVVGTAEVKVKATSDGGKQKADAALNLSSLDVNLANTVVRGTGGITLKAEPAGGDVTIVTAANFDGMSIQKFGEGGAPVVNKPAGLPLRLDVNAKKASDRADVSSLALAIGKSTVSGSGNVTDLDKDEPKLFVDLGDVSLGFDDLRTALPGASRLPAGGRFTGKVRLAGGTSASTLAVDAKGVNLVFGSSRIAGDVNVKNLSDPVLDVNLPTVDLAFDDVRNVSESAGDLPAGGRFKGTVKLAGDTAKSSTVKANVKIDSLVAQGSSMKGAIQIENLDKPRFELGLQADNLDVDKLRESFGGKDDGKTATKKQKDDNPHGLSKSTRALLADVNGKGTVTAEKAVVKGIPVQKFKGVLVMTRGVAKFDTLEFNMYGGTVAATGTMLDLPAERTGYDLKLKGKDIDLGAAIADQTSLGKIFTGRISPDISVKGKGLAPGDFAITADGPAELTFKSLSINTLDLLGPIGEALNKTGKLPGGKLGFTTAGMSGTELEGFKALTKFIGGKLKLEKPVETESKAGKITWEGAVGLDAGLDLRATLGLTPAMLSKMSNGKLKVKEPVPVPLRIGGTWDKPQVTGVDVGRLVTGILANVAGGAVDKAKDAAGDAAKNILGSVTGSDKKKDDKKKDDKKKDDKKKDDKKKSTADKAKDAAKDAAKGIFGK